jgi:phenylalanyl-tRNA synthetase beta chain
MRHSLLASVLEIVERNARFFDRIVLFEIGPVYWVSEGETLPDEKLQLVLAITGAREAGSWKGGDTNPMDFYDLKGIVDGLLDGLKTDSAELEHGDHPSFHPGKCAYIVIGDTRIGVIGELHPSVKERYELLDAPVLAAEIDLDRLLPMIPEAIESTPIPAFPPVLEDLAVVVDEKVSASTVEDLIQEAGGELLRDVVLFDLYQGEQIQRGKKSLAYSLVYQAADRTLTDEEVAQIRTRILGHLASEIGAKLRE